MFKKQLQKAQKLIKETKIKQAQLIFKAILKKSTNIELTCSQIIKLKPNLSTYPYFCLGQVYEDIKDYEKAENIFLKSIQLWPQDPNCYQNLSRIYINQQKYKESIKISKQWKKISPDNVQPYKNLVLAYLNLDNKNEVNKLKKYLQKLNETTKNLSIKLQTFEILATIYWDSKQYQKAQKVYRKIIQLDSKNAKNYCNLADACYYLLKYKQAQQFYEKSLQLQANIKTYQGLGNVHYFKKQFNEALKNYLQSFKFDNKNAQMANTIGQTYLLNGQMKNSFIYFQKANKLDEKNILYKINLGYAYLNAQKIYEGFCQFEMAKNLLRINPEIGSKRIKSFIFQTINFFDFCNEAIQQLKKQHFQCDLKDKIQIKQIKNIQKPFIKFNRIVLQDQIKFQNESNYTKYEQYQYEKQKEITLNQIRQAINMFSNEIKLQEISQLNNQQQIQEYGSKIMIKEDGISGQKTIQKQKKQSFLQKKSLLEKNEMQDKNNINKFVFNQKNFFDQYVKNNKKQIKRPVSISSSSCKIISSSSSKIKSEQINLPTVLPIQEENICKIKCNENNKRIFRIQVGIEKDQNLNQKKREKNFEKKLIQFCNQNLTNFKLKVQEVSMQTLIQKGSTPKK